jgi:hypothetical protein
MDADVIQMHIEEIDAGIDNEGKANGLSRKSGNVRATLRPIVKQRVVGLRGIDRGQRGVIGIANFDPELLVGREIGAEIPDAINPTQCDRGGISRKWNVLI